MTLGQQPSYPGNPSTQVLKILIQDDDCGGGDRDKSAGHDLADQLDLEPALPS